MSYGDIPERANDYTDKSLQLPRGVILNGKLDEIHDVDLTRRRQVQEFVNHSWYKYADESKGLHPWDGVTEPNYVLGPNAKGTKTRIEALDEGAKYSWIKSPRWKGNAVEVGPLARYVIGYAPGQAGVQGAGRPAAEGAGRPGDRAVLDLRPHGGARAGMRHGRRISCATSRTS